MVNNINFNNSTNYLQESAIEELQRMYPDKFFIVWEQLVNEELDDNGNIFYNIDYKHKKWVLACFENQWEDTINKETGELEKKWIKTLLGEQNKILFNQIEENLTIIDLQSIRGWKNKKLFWEELDNNNELQLLSWWCFEIRTSEKWNKHLVLKERDWWNVDVWLLTWVAGRAESVDIEKESLKEFVEEWSYLWYVDWKLHIVVPSVENWEELIDNFVERFIEKTKRNAINNSTATLWFLEEKYKALNEELKEKLEKNEELTEKEEQDLKKYKKLSKKFNKNFVDKKLNYDNLWEQLQEILSNWRVLFYDIKENNTEYNAKINIAWKIFEWFAFNDYDDNRTTEFRKIYDIDLSKVKNNQWKVLDVDYIWRLGRASTMFLESENQEPRTINLSYLKKYKNIFNRLVPATKVFVNKALWLDKKFNELKEKDFKKLTIEDIDFILKYIWFKKYKNKDDKVIYKKDEIKLTNLEEIKAFFKT